jgi:hypothetical protein
MKHLSIDWTFHICPVINAPETFKKEQSLKEKLESGEDFGVWEGMQALTGTDRDVSTEAEANGGF